MDHFAETFIPSSGKIKRKFDGLDEASKGYKTTFYLEKEEDIPKSEVTKTVETTLEKEET